MLDTSTARFDVAEVVRASRRSGGRPLRWQGLSVYLDADRNEIVIGGTIVLTIHRVLVPLPCGTIVRGPVLAHCPRGCGRRARVLWMHVFDGRSSLACRACACVTYATAATRCEVERARLAHDRLRGRLGLIKPWQTFERARYQRRHTYERAAERLDDARIRYEAALGS